MGLIDALRRPAVRIPILLAVTIVAGVLLSRQCNRMLRARELATKRHLRCIDLVTRAAREATESGRRPTSLAELVGTPGNPGAIEALFLREYAALPEFAAPGSDPGSSSPAPRPAPPSIQVQDGDLLWEGYRYRLWPRPDHARDFVIFAWPETAGAGQLTSAWLSAEPARLYYTYARRYAGAGGAPVPADLGEPFAGRITLLEGLDPRKPPDDFMERADQSGGRQWLRMDTMGAAGRPFEGASP